MRYTIFSIDDTREHYKQAIRDTLRGWDEIETKCVDGRQPHELAFWMNFYGIEVKNKGLRVGHLGIWLTVLNALTLIEEPLVTFEDDAVLGPMFEYQFNKRVKQLPKDTDFFSLFIPRDSDHEYSEKHAVSNALTKTYTRYGGVSMYYTPKGAKKIQELLFRDGFTDQYDNTLYRYSAAGELNGYCSKPTVSDLVKITGTERSIVQESDQWRSR